MPNGRILDTLHPIGSPVVKPDVARAVGRRVRAALALAERSLEDVAPELNISTRTLGRVLSGERQLRDWELRRLSEILRVPDWFLREGLEGQPTLDDLADRELRDELRRQHDEVIARLDRLGEQLRVIALGPGPHG
jgi:hypothetical protein